MRAIDRFVSMLRAYSERLSGRRPMQDAITKSDLREMENRIMAKQSEIAADLRAQADRINKIASETRTLLTRIEELQEAVNNQDEASEELTAASQAVAAQLAVVDDLVPDAPTEPPTA